MRRLGIVFLILIMIFSICSCSESDYSTVKSNGKLVVGVTDYKPLTFRDADGMWTGFDAELAKITAENLGVDIEFKIINWDEKVEALDSGEVDCVWNGYAITKHDVVSFSNHYAVNYPVVIVNSNKKDTIIDLEHLKGLRVAYELGSTSELIVNNFEFDVVKSPCNLQKEAILSVVNGDADACVVDKTIYNSLVHTDLCIIKTFASEKFAVGFRKGSDLVREINNILSELKENGTISDLAQKYNVEIE